MFQCMLQGLSSKPFFRNTVRLSVADAALLCGVGAGPPFAFAQNGAYDPANYAWQSGAIAVMITTIVVWSNFMIVKPDAAAAATKAAAAEGPPIISPFDIMIKHGKNLPLEDWRPAN